MLKSILKLNGVKTIDKEAQKGITGRRSGFCCEWCSDGTCNAWVDSPFAKCTSTLECF